MGAHIFICILSLHFADSKLPKNIKNGLTECTQWGRVLYMREVSIRKFRKNMAKELKVLPFKITKNGRVIAIVRGLDD